MASSGLALSSSTAANDSGLGIRVSNPNFSRWPVTLTIGELDPALTQGLAHSSPDLRRGVYILACKTNDRTI